MSRVTSNCGWTITWMLRCWLDSSIVIESTRNGMSSVTTSTTECALADQPCSETVGVKTRTCAVPCGRLVASL